MKKMNKIIAMLLAALSVFSFVGCKNDKGSDNSSSPGTSEILDTTQDKNFGKVEGTLHKVNVRESNREFIRRGETEYRVIVDQEESEASTAAAFIAKHLSACSGANVNVVSYANASSLAWSNDAKYIVVGRGALFNAAGLTMPTEDLGQSGYYIKSVGDSVFIAAKVVHGYQMGAIAFLRETIGYDMYSDEIVSYDREPTTLPTMDIVEKPDFDYRQDPLNCLSNDQKYGMGFAMDSGIMKFEGGDVHNTFKILPPDQYQAKHPKWYADNGSQLCYTAHGDAAEYEAMKNEIFEKMKVCVDANPTIDTISISQEDIPQNCTCETCTAISDKYGTINGTTIPFLNEMSIKLENYLAQQAEENGTEPRTVYLIQFAYRVTADAPVKEDENGEWVPIDETVRCRDNVGVYIAPIEASYTRSFYDEFNETHATRMKKWSAVTDNIYFWLYETNFYDYMFPYNSWDSMVENYRFTREMSGRFMFSQEQLGNGGASHFTQLKIYIDSKAQFDVNVNVKEVIEKYFKNYFGEAAEPMKDYFDELQTYLYLLQDTYPEQLNGRINEPIGKNIALYWPRAILQNYMRYINMAYTAIEPLKETAPERYQALYDNITIESLFPRYILAKHYGGTYQSETISDMRISFRDDCLRLGIQFEREHVDMSGLYTTWGI